MKIQTFFSGALICISMNSTAQEFVDMLYYNNYLAMNSETRTSTDASGIVNICYENGILQETGMQINGLKHGAWFRYSKEGGKLMEAHYVKGIRDGKWQIWDENGNLRVVMHYSNGKRVREWIIFDERGGQVSMETFSTKL